MSKEEGIDHLLDLETVAMTLGVKVQDVLELLEKQNVQYIKVGKKCFVLNSLFMGIFLGMEDQKIQKGIENFGIPVTEKQILHYTIEVLKEMKRISMKELKDVLKERMPLSEEDLTVLKGRKDTRFDQKVRNLICHRDNNKLSEYCDYEKKGKQVILILKK